MLLWKNTLDEHKRVILQKGTGNLEFGWLIPIAGLLHVEINIARVFMNLNWEVFTKECVKILGFQSPKAQKYLKKGSDHHKTWHFLEILYVAVALELVIPYVRESDGSNPCVEGYWAWSKGIDDPNYIYMQQSVFVYLHAMMMLRSGESPVLSYCIARFLREPLQEFLKMKE